MVISSYEVGSDDFLYSIQFTVNEDSSESEEPHFEAVVLCYPKMTRSSSNSLTNHHQDADLEKGGFTGTGDVFSALFLAHYHLFSSLPDYLSSFSLNQPSDHPLEEQEGELNHKDQLIDPSPLLSTISSLQSILQLTVDSGRKELALVSSHNAILFPPSYSSNHKSSNILPFTSQQDNHQLEEGEEKEG